MMGRWWSAGLEAVVVLAGAAACTAMPGLPPKQGFAKLVVETPHIQRAEGSSFVQVRHDTNSHHRAREPGARQTASGVLTHRGPVALAVPPGAPHLEQAAATGWGDQPRLEARTFAAVAKPAERSAGLKRKLVDKRRPLTWGRVWRRLPDNAGVSGRLARVVSSSGADIWKRSMTWVNVTGRHPDGVISHLQNGRVEWAAVSFLSLDVLYVVSLVAYPTVLICLLLLLAVLASVSMADRHPTERKEGAPAPHGRGPLAGLGAALLSRRSRQLFMFWSVFCRAIPALMVFGTPSLLVALTYPYPQEVFVMLAVVSWAMFVSNGIHTVFFCSCMLPKLQRVSDMFAMQQEQAILEEERQVLHWVVLPNYREDVEVLSDTLESIARSAIAREQICVLLAMEEREPQARSMAEVLKARFNGKFREVATTFHPLDLPNDPPGKASNVAWAFRWLDGRLEKDASFVLLTIADADSDFHRLYFEGLTRQFVETEPSHRARTIWQAPIFHLKNYHRQPMPLVLGSIFGALSEIALLADPNAVRFPYSTYSLPLELARYVGGWDADWIAEDWHMGIKCFFHTLGAARVRPLAFPVVSYLPEESTWFGTLWARWSQAKRHALGFSDVSYYFMTLPLVFCRLTSVAGTANGPHLQDFCFMFVHGISYIVRLVNTHVVIGITGLYMIMSCMLKGIMSYALQDLRHIGQLFERSGVTCGALFKCSLALIIMMTLGFQVLYAILRDRVEPTATTWRRVFACKTLHWAYSLVACVFFAVPYCIGLAAAVWIAAIKVLLSGTTAFEYEVASKPTKYAHL